MSLHDRILASQHRADLLVDLFRKAGPSGSSSRDIIAEAAGGTGRENIAHHQEQYRYGLRGWSFVAIRSVSQKVASQSIHVSRPPSSNSRRIKAISDPLDPLPSHPILDLLAAPNPLMSTWGLVTSTVQSLLITGRAFWWFLREGSQIRVFPLPSHWVEAKNPATRSSWLIRPPGATEAIEQPAENVMFVNIPDPSDPFRSISLLQAQDEAVLTDATIRRSQRDSLSSTINPKTIITIGQIQNEQGRNIGRPRLTDTQKNQLINAIQQSYAGLMNSNKPMILDGAVEKIERFDKSPAELGFLESEKLNKARIMQGFGVNPVAAGEVENVNYASAYIATQTFCENTVNPIIELLSQAMTRSLPPLFKDNVIVWIDPARANDPERTLRELQFAAKHGAVTGNEIRTHLGYAPLPGLDEPVSVQAGPPAGGSPDGDQDREDDDSVPAGVKHLLHASPGALRAMRNGNGRAANGRR